MGSNKNKNQKKNKHRPISQEAMNRLNNKVVEIQRSADEEYTFEEDLTNVERGYVHKLCRRYGLISKSTGKASKRRLTVRKNRECKGTDAEKTSKKQGMASIKEKLTPLTFSEEGKDVLRDLFSSYPPIDEDTSDELVRQRRRSNNYARGDDDMFSKTSLSKADIEKKQQLLVSIQKTPKLREIMAKRSQLPIAPFKDVITSEVDTHQVVLISGETGCGKTTQVPQYILDSIWNKGEACKIICTQPRRISATSVAERIAAERGQIIGEDVGYKIRLESKGGKQSSIVFCTNGVLLKILCSKGTNSDKSHDALSKLTHIIVDEIHERDRYSDFMLALLRDELPLYPHLRLIIMSATLDAEMFSNYFGGCPVIRVPGFTHPVKSFYLEDVISILNSSESNQLPSTSSNIPIDGPDLTEKDKAELDEAITMAWSSNEFEPLLDWVQSEGITKVFNYQHSMTGMTPLMVFAGKGRVGEVCLLLSLGSDCNLQDNDGTTALELAKRENQVLAVEYISSHVKNAESNLQENKKLLDKYLKSISPQLIDVALIEKLLRKICSESEDGAILVFIPGWEDIKKIQERLLGSSYFKTESKFMILALHSMVPPKDQKLVFQRPPAGCRKIILSTNIAETSVTIDDVVYVIDSGKMKEKSYDPYSNVSTLQSSWISKASVKQREGRAGRCQPGICYHLFTRDREASLPSFQVPEIKRVPIEELCLQIKMMDPDCDIETILRKTIDPPVYDTIRNGIKVLQDIGALSEDEKLTVLGEKLGALPVHPLVSKMLFLAILLKCLDPALTFACASDYKDPFVFPLDGRDKAAAAKAKLASIYAGNSDQLAVIAAFECWKSAKEQRNESLFYSRYFVSPSTMYMLSGMRKQLLNELRRHGFLPGDISSYNVNAQNPGIIHAVLVSGLYPMVGRLIPGKNGKARLVETSSGSKVRLHLRSSSSGLSLKRGDKGPLIIFDEITRTDYGESIRDCTVIGPLPLLLTAAEIAVAPFDDGGEASNDDNSSHDNVMEMGNDGVVASNNVMSSPSETVMVIIDRWLSFGLTALDFAQIYCLRDRVSKAVTFTVTHPGCELPPLLAASMHALACLLLYDGLSNIALPCGDSSTSAHEGTSNYFGDDEFLLSLLAPAPSEFRHYMNPPPAYDDVGNLYQGYSLSSSSQRIYQLPAFGKLSIQSPSAAPGPHQVHSPHRAMNTIKKKEQKVTAQPGSSSSSSIQQPPSVATGPAQNPLSRRARKKQRQAASLMNPNSIPFGGQPHPSIQQRQAASLMNPNLIPLGGQPHPTIESAPDSTQPLQVPPSVKSKTKKLKKAEQLSQKPKLVGYGAATFGPYGPRGPMAGVGLKRPRGAF